ncbi:MAG: hypothetical protein ABR947_05505 [Solirubrobacteraceae bacterium]
MRCVHCGDVIGVYEPLVAQTGDEVRETSRAAEPDVAEHGARLYHRECFAALKRPGEE